LLLNKVLTFELRLAASALATKLLQFSGVSVFREGNIIDIGVTQLQVVDACSGLRYFMPLLLLSLLMGYLFSRGWWRRGALILLVLPLSVGLNALRIWLTGMLTVHGHAELAQDFFHDLSGWVIFLIAGGILYLVSLALKRVGRVPPEMALIDRGAPSSGLLRPALLTAVVCLVFAGSGWALKRVPSATHLPPRASFDGFPMQIGGWVGQRAYIDQEIMDNLWADDYVTGTFSKAGLPNAIYLLIPFYKYQGTMHTAHAPQACLLGGGWAPLTEAERPAGMGGGQEIVIKTMLMQKGDSRILSSYFFFQRGRVITSPWWNKLYLMYDAFTRHRTDGALVRVEMTLAPGQTEEQAFPVLEAFIAEIWKILPEYVPL
jgi:exosortase D (VPLPA-CTERM-specific)